MSKEESSNNISTHNGISYNTTIAAAVATAVGGFAPAHAQDTNIGIEEITVTATKRGDMSIQDLAGSIQAFGTEDIRNQNLFSMEDYVKFTPSMSYFGNQSGAGKIFFRGIADAPDTFIATSSAAVYLDEQPLTQSAQVDVRLIDIERVEALSGPQGTLFGSSSQSGTLRIVTNKPDPTAFESFADITLKTMSEGDPSYDISAMVNIPLIEDKFALRLVGFSATEGGFIDNVLGTTANYEYLEKAPVTGPQFNTDAVEENWNETTIDGARVGAKWYINDEWSATGMISHQSATANAENTYDPTVGDLQLIAFSPDRRTDDWTAFSLSLEGAIGDLQFTSASAYFTRDSVYVQDTTAYAAYFGSFCYMHPVYQTATYNIYCFQPAGQYYWYADPIGFLVNDQKNTSVSQEFRVSFSNERLDWVAGVFWEDRDEEWDFTTETEGYGESQGWDHWNTLYNVSPPSSDVWWFSQDSTNWETLAFEVESEKVYYVELPGGRLTPAGQMLDGTAADKHGCIFSEAPCGNGVDSVDSDNPADDGFNRINSSDDDVAIKVSAQWNLSDDKMMYALYSEGFRPGGVNRNRGAPILPPGYNADFLKNYEFGLKSQWADGRLQVNAVAFFQDWDDYQIEVVDPSHSPCSDVDYVPCGQPWQKGVTNVGNASSDGVELQVEAAPSEGLSLRFNATWLSSEVNDEVPGLDGIGPGSKLPFAPEFKGSFYSQYNWGTSLFGSDEAFVQFSFTHVGSSLNMVQALVLYDDGPAPQMKMEGYQTTNLKFGLVGGDWEANLFVNNLGDERGQLYHDVTDFEPYFGRSRLSVIRPREIGVRFYKRWE
jgi:outer membrane receptor protein involved in Fe transport